MTVLPHSEGQRNAAIGQRHRTTRDGLLGDWRCFFSGKDPLGFSNVNDDTSIRTVHAALEAGIRLFDTAAVYGAGHSEKLLGTALKHRPDALIISMGPLPADVMSEIETRIQRDPEGEARAR